MSPEISLQPYTTCHIFPCHYWKPWTCWSIHTARWAETFPSVNNHTGSAQATHWVCLAVMQFQTSQMLEGDVSAIQEAWTKVLSICTFLHRTPLQFDAVILNSMLFLSAEQIFLEHLLCPRCSSRLCVFNSSEGNKNVVLMDLISQLGYMCSCVLGRVCVMMLGEQLSSIR